MDRATQTSYGHLIRTQERYKKDLDERVREVNRNINAGDFVYWDPTSGRTKPRSTATNTALPSTLRSTAIGPFAVTGNDVRTNVLDCDGKAARASADRVAFSPTSPRIVWFAATLAQLAAKLHNEPTHTIHILPDHRVTAHEDKKFLIKWFADHTPTWKPRSHVPQELVSQYFTRHRKQTSRRFP